MSLRHILAAIVTIIAIPLFVYSWLESRADRAQFQATLAAQQQIINAAESREHESAAELKTSLDQIAELKRQIQTPQQIISSLPQFLPLPQPITLSTAPQHAQPRSSQTLDNSPGTPLEIVTQKGSAALDASAPSAATATSLPDSPTPRRSAAELLHALRSDLSKYKSPRSESPIPPGAAPSQNAQASTSPGGQSENAEIPEADLKPLYNFVQDCRACQAQLAAANANLNDEQARSAALTRERDAAVTAAIGGSFWRQLKRNTKWLAIGAAIGAVVTRTR
ncbi:MAG: hypothetical protein WA734_20455 [Candidatus Acidiferrales bacterium]